ncbi:MAG: phage tail protein, partial [Pseudomonadota bacterium]
MSESPLFEVELYALEGTSATFRLTPHEFDVEIGGQRYERCPLERSALALGAEAAKSALELTLPP